MSFRMAVLAALLAAVASSPSLAQLQHRPALEGGIPDDPRSHGWSDSHLLSLNGVVRGIGGAPLPGVRIELRDLLGGAVVESGLTDQTGTFEFRNVPTGKYELVATLGLNEVRERFEMNLASTSVTVQMPIPGDVKGGEQTVSVAQMKVPDKARSELQKAQSLLAKNKTEEGRKHVLKALEIYPDYAQAHMMLGIVDLDGQQWQDAGAELEKSIKLDPNTPMAYIALAATYNATGDYDSALRSINSGSRLAAASWQMPFEAAKSYLGKGDFAAALEAIERAQKLATTDYPPIHLVKAHALLGLKEYTPAVAELEAYLKQEPSGPNSARARQALDAARAFNSK